MEGSRRAQWGRVGRWGCAFREQVGGGSCQSDVGPGGTPSGSERFAAVFILLWCPLQPLISGSPPAGADLVLGVGWSARGAEVPRPSSRGPFLSLCNSVSTARALTGGSVERARAAGKGLGQDVVSVGLMMLRRGVGGRAFTGPQMQDLLNVKPHPVVSP